MCAQCIQSKHDCTQWLSAMWKNARPKSFTLSSNENALTSSEYWNRKKSDQLAPFYRCDPNDRQYVWCLFLFCTDWHFFSFSFSFSVFPFRISSFHRSIIRYMVGNLEHGHFHFMLLFVFPFLSVVARLSSLSFLSFFLVSRLYLFALVEFVIFTLMPVYCSILKFLSCFRKHFLSTTFGKTHWKIEKKFHSISL